MNTIRRPTIALLTTGGTIAGTADSPLDTTTYTAGNLSADALLGTVPGIHDLAELHVVPLFNIDSVDITFAHWQTLAERTQSLLDAPGIDGVVITHGTDTLEESAFLLDHSLCGDKPVVMTGAMRPASALSSDGPMNLYDAVSVAVHPDSAARGVIVCFDRSLFSGGMLRKQHTDKLGAFCGGNIGRIGQAGPVRFFAPPFRPPAPQHLPPLHELPRVEVLYVTGGSSPELFEMAVAAGARGIVLALPGNGNLPAAWENSVQRAVAGGTPVIRASRCANGEVTPHPVDERTGCRPAGNLSAAAARLALALHLAASAAENRIEPRDQT